MTLAIKHKKALSIPDDPAAAAAGLVLPSDWNDTLNAVMASGFLLGRSTAGDGAVEELDAATARALLGVVLGTAAGNVPVLDGFGKLATSVLPALALTDTFEVASQAAMLALTAQQGDIAIRMDLNKTFVLSSNSPSTLADWKELRTPTDSVLSIAGLTGTITAAALRTALNLVVGTNVQAYDAATAYTNQDQTWTGAHKSGTGTVLTSGATITSTLSDWEGNRASLTLANNATLANPTDIATMVGFVGRIVCQQDATGGRTLAFGSSWFPIGASTAPSVPSGASAKFRIDFEVVNSARIDFSLSKVGA